MSSGCERYGQGKAVVRMPRHCSMLSGRGKNIQGYVIIINDATPSMDHRPDKYLVELLMKDTPLLRYNDHDRHLSKFF